MDRPAHCREPGAMSRASLLTPSTDYMPALLECLERIASAHERLADVAEEAVDELRETASGIEAAVSALEDVGRSIDNIK